MFTFVIKHLVRLKGNPIIAVKSISEMDIYFLEFTDSKLIKFNDDVVVQVTLKISNEICQSIILIAHPMTNNNVRRNQGCFDHDTQHITRNNYGCIYRVISCQLSRINVSISTNYQQIIILIVKMATPTTICN